MILAAALAACGKSEPPPAGPELAAPDRAFPSAGRTVTNEKVAAQAEVSASSGPVELTFLLHKTTITVGESLWHQLRVRNIGKRELLVTDEVFHEPWQLRYHSPDRNGIGGFGIYIEAFGPDGARLGKVLYMEDAIMPEVSGLLEIDGPREQAMVDDWKRQGLSEFEIGSKLIEFNTSKRHAAQSKEESPVIKLQPGEVAETKSWFYHTKQARRKKLPAPRPIGNFAQLEFFALDKPGKYKIRAVYDYSISAVKLAEYRKLGWSTDEHVLARTPWVAVTVLP